MNTHPIDGLRNARVRRFEGAAPVAADARCLLAWNAARTPAQRLAWSTPYAYGRRGAILGGGRRRVAVSWSTLPRSSAVALLHSEASGPWRGPIVDAETAALYQISRIEPR